MSGSYFVEWRIMICPFCGSKEVNKKGIDNVKGVAKQRFRCKNCKKNFYDSSVGEGAREENSYEQDDNFINIVCASRRMLNKDEVLKQFNVDMNIWEVERFRVKTSEGYRKDRSVEWPCGSWPRRWPRATAWC